MVQSYDCQGITGISQLHNFTTYDPWALGPLSIYGGLRNNCKAHKNHVITIIMTLILKSTRFQIN